MQAANSNEIAHRLTRELPDDANWDDAMAKAYERQMIEAGLADSEADRIMAVETLRRKYGLSE